MQGMEKNRTMPGFAGACYRPRRNRLIGRAEYGRKGAPRDIRPKKGGAASRRPAVFVNPQG